MGSLRGVDFKGEVWEFATCQAVVSGSAQTLAKTRVFHVRFWGLLCFSEGKGLAGSVLLCSPNSGAGVVSPEGGDGLLPSSQGELTRRAHFPLDLPVHLSAATAGSCHQLSPSAVAHCPLSHYSNTYPST